MTLILLFALFFVGGPLIFRVLMQSAPTARTLRVLGLGTVAVAVCGLALRYGAPQDWGRNMILTGAGILAIWFAWIGVLAFAAQMLRRADPGPRMRRLTAVVGALGTTVPWFGFAYASMSGF